MELKTINRNRIFNLIYDKRKISRQEIADALELSLPTVNMNLKELTEEGYIEVDGSFNSTGGRKAQAFTVCDNCKYIFAVNFKPGYIKTSLVNLYGDILADNKIGIDYYDDEDDVNIGQVINMQIDNLIKKFKVGKKKILGVGITIPGIFDESMQMILSAPTIDIRDYPLSRITGEIPYFCIVMNDAKAEAMADYWFCKDTSDKVYLMLNYGVGGAFIHGDEIKRGIHNRSGEFGHMTLYPQGRKCTCGKRGCFEAYVSMRRLSDDMGMPLDRFFEGLRQADKRCQNVFNQYIDDLTTGINNLYTMVDDRIVIGGPVSYYLRDYAGIIQKLLAEKNSFGMKELEPEFAKCSPKQADIGVALVIISDFLKNI